MSSDLPDYTRYIDVKSVTEVFTALKAMKEGVLETAAAAAINATATLYTVPSGKIFYWFLYDLNVKHYAAGTHIGRIEAVINGKIEDIAYIDMPDGVDHGHTQNAFTMIKLAAGDKIRVRSNANAAAAAVIAGFELSA